LTTTSSDSVTSSSLSIYSTPTISNNSHLTEKIAIPIGTVVGTITIGGVTYYLYKKRKNKQNQQSGNQDNNTQLFELINTSQPTIKSENTGQPIIASATTEPKEQSRITSLGMPIVWELAVPTEEVTVTENTNKKEIQLGEVITKQTELDQLIIQTKQKIGSNLAVALETLLDAQTEITKGNSTYAVRKDQREAKKELLTKLSEEEINHLCQLQSEVVQQKQLQAQVEIPPKK